MAREEATSIHWHHGLCGKSEEAHSCSACATHKVVNERSLKIANKCYLPTQNNLLFVPSFGQSLSSWPVIQMLTLTHVDRTLSKHFKLKILVEFP